MARPVHPDTLFHLEPVDDRTRQLIQHPDNAPFISTSSGGSPALEIGYHVSSRARGGRVIARLGREADLILPARTISHMHFAFEVHPISHALLICNRATKAQSIVIRPFGFRADGDFRQLVLIPGNDYDIIFGDVAQPFHFKVCWRLDESSTMDAVESGFQTAETRAVDPRWLKTEDGTDSDLQLWYDSRLLSTSSGSIRDAQLEEQLGSGSFGTVHRGIDVDSGHFIAIKIAKPVNDRQEMNLHREIMTLQTLKHACIIEFLGHQQCGRRRTNAEIRIFMPLRTGNVSNLAPLPENTEHRVISQLSYQMLSALDYLSARNLCHRDVKPANILYDVNGEQYNFQLADFGLVNHQDQAETICGTRLFSAPELHPDYGLGTYRQSPKMDVWSLFVTLISLMPNTRFNEERLAACSYSDILAVVRIAAAVHLPGLKEMARENPDLRASAAQVLVMRFAGDGLTTPLSEIGPIAELSTLAADGQPGPSVEPNRKAAEDEFPEFEGMQEDYSSAAFRIATNKEQHQIAPQALSSMAGPSTRRANAQP